MAQTVDDDDDDDDSLHTLILTYIHTYIQVNVDNNMVGWYRTMQLGHFSEAGIKTDAGGMRSQRTLFDVPPALMVCM